MPVYVLTLDKAGPKNLTPNQAKSAGDPWIDQVTVKTLGPVVSVDAPTPPANLQIPS